MPPPPVATAAPARRTPLEGLEYFGNKLPEPTLLFALLAALVVAISAIGVSMGWRVQPVKPTLVLETTRDANGVEKQVPKMTADGKPEIRLVASGAPLEPRNLLSTEGIYWMFSSMLRNFTGMPALPLIFVAMIGIGLAEKFGFFSALMRWLAFLTPRRWLSPVVVFLGANSSVASDAGYIILPPLAAALYLAVGRHPVAGLAAAFAGVAGGFGAGFFPTGGDGVLAGFAQDAARVIDAGYAVGILHNYYFKMVSAIVVMLAGWWVTDRIIEPRLFRLHRNEAGTDAADTLANLKPTPTERRALFASLATMGLLLAAFALLIFAPGMPLHGDGKPTLANGRVLVQQAVAIEPAGQTPAVSVPEHDILANDPFLIYEKSVPGRLVESPGPRWSQVIVPLILIVFLIPGVVYGLLTGQLRTQRNLVGALEHGIAGIVSVLVILFFLAQFVNYLSYSNLDRMLAYTGGSLLVEASLPIPRLIALFVLVVVFGDFAMSGMLSKFGVLAPIFIPMFMMVGISPELTTAAYRIGDSVVNVVTPLNSYMLIILAVFQKYRSHAGLGSLIALMLPYSVVLGLTWTGLLLLWNVTGAALGPGASLFYLPGV